MKERGRQVRKGEAMMHTQTYNFKNLYRPSELHGTNMPSASKAERRTSTCLYHTGSSGYLRPGAPMCILV